MIQNGIMPCGINDEGLLVVIRAMTTYQDDNLGLNERSCVREALFMDRDLRKAYSRRTGTSSEPSESEIFAVLLNKAKDWYSIIRLNLTRPIPSHIPLPIPETA